MKNVLKLSIALLCASSIYANDVSRSYFSARPYHPHVTNQNLLVDQAHDTGRVLQKANLQGSFFVSASSCANDLARYFFFHDKTELVVREADPADTISAELSQDILSGDFNLDSTDGDFHSTIKLKPKQTTFGIALSYRKPFWEKYWFALEAPLVYVKNNLNLSETVHTTGSGASGDNGFDSVAEVGTMIDAFKQAGMLYGKIDGAQHKTRLADLTIKLGYDCPRLNRKDLYMTTYVGLVLPTGNKAEGVYMFEPIAGNGGHFAFMLGTNGELHLQKFHKGNLWLRWGAESQYLFQNTQKRSFDLKRNGPWSRYLNMFATSAKRTSGTVSDITFGINLMTRDAKVTPGYTGTFNTCLNYLEDKWHGSVGYTTFVRQAEKIELKNAWDQGPMVSGYIADGTNLTNPLRTIGTGMQEVSTAEDNFIKEADIDLNSAAHPAAVSHMLYGTIGMFKQCKRTMDYEMGASYEFSRQNTAISRWGIWGKVQASF